MKTKKYKIVYQENGKIKNKNIETIDLDNELLPNNVIEIKRVRKNLDLNILKFERIKDKDIKNRLQELSLMLNANLLLDEAFDILIKNEKSKSLRSFLNSLKSSFVNSFDIDTSLKNYRINPLIKSFFKITQDNGNAKENIKFLSEIINENHEIKKEFLKNMTYPIVLLITFFISLIGVFNFVVPSFESIFTNSKMILPLATKTLLFTKEIFDNYLLLIIGAFIAIVFLFVYIYKYSKVFSYFIDMVLAEKSFIISDLYKLKVLYTYFVVVNILLQNRYDFLESISKSKVLLNNKYLLDKITQIENLLKNGKSVRLAFESTNLFDDVTLSLISTGEVTNSLDDVIHEIKKMYKVRFNDKLKLFSILIEPLFFIIIMALIIWIILAIFVPLWSMSDMLKF